MRAPETVPRLLTRSNRATAGSGTEFGGLLRAAGAAAAAAAGAFGECPDLMLPFQLWQQLCGSATGSVYVGCGLSLKPPTLSQDPALRGP